MADHKRATEVTVAPLQERSGFQEFVVKYWKAAAAFLIAVSAVFLLIEYNAARAVEAEDQQWSDFFSGVDMTQLGTPESALALRETASSLGEVPAGAWAAALEVAVSIDNREFEQASQALENLRANHASDPLVSVRRDWGGSGHELDLVEYLELQLQEWRGWAQAHPSLFANPEPAADAPRVRLTTSEGSVVVALYPDRAPLHCANFLARVAEGYYDGTRFHRILAGQLVQGGDPNTRAQEGIEDDRATWGQGGPEERVPAEDSGLFHFKGALAMGKKGLEPESSGSQFYVTVGPFHGQDGRYTVFGTVVEGQDVFDRIAAGEVSEQFAQQPVEPVELVGAEILP